MKRNVKKILGLLSLMFIMLNILIGTQFFFHGTCYGFAS